MEPRLGRAFLWRGGIAATVLIAPSIVRPDPPEAMLAVWAVFGAALLVLAILPRSILPAPGKKLSLSVSLLSLPLAVTLLLAIFPGKPDMAVTAWIVLAAGSCMAPFGASYFPVRVLPWNEEKTWGGFVFFTGSAFGGCWIASRLPWADNLAMPPMGVLALPVIAAALSSTLPFRFDKSLLVAMTAGLLAGVSSGGSPSVDLYFSMETLLFITAVLLVAAIGMRLGAFDRSGAFTGTVLVLPIALAFKWAGLTAVLFFVALGSIASRLRRGAGGAPRTARHGIANLAAASFACLLVLQGEEPLGVIAFCGAITAALADTIAGEAGLFAGAVPRLITTGRKVSPGTDGGVTLPGTAAGVIVSLLSALLCWKLSLYGIAAVPAVTCAGIAGTTIDSILGATLERRGFLGNADVNFLATLGGAATAAAMIHIAGS